MSIYFMHTQFKYILIQFNDVKLCISWVFSSCYDRDYKHYLVAMITVFDCDQYPDFSHKVKVWWGNGRARDRTQWE